MRSSEGCSARHSMYSCEHVAAGDVAPALTRMGWPGLVRRSASVCSRTATWSCSGMPRSMPITRMGSSAPSSAMMSKPADPTSGSRQPAQYCRTWSSSAAMRLGVKTRDIEPAVHRCGRRILEHDHAGRELDVRLDDVEDVAAGVGEHLPVHERLLDVRMAGQRPEVVAIVVVGGRLLPESRVHGIRVGVDADVVGVEVHAGVGRRARLGVVPYLERPFNFSEQRGRADGQSDALGLATEEKRKRLLDATEEIMLKEGYAAVSSGASPPPSASRRRSCTTTSRRSTTSSSPCSNGAAGRNVERMSEALASA